MNNRCQVLIVDDSDIDRRMVELILSKAGISYASVASGEQALQQVLGLQPMVILLDVNMPGLDGFETCRRLKAQEATAKTPVIFFTAHTGRDIESQCFDAGGADFVTKPAIAATLLARIRTQITVSSDRRRLEGMFRDVIEFAPVAILLTDLNGTVVTANAHALDCFQVGRRDILDSELARWIPDIATRIQLGTAPAHADQFEMQGQRADGSRFAADITVGNLRSTKQPLDLFIVRNIEERLQTLKELRDSRQRLRELGAQNELARENERKHIAREVHDELGQVITALRMDLSMVEMRFGAQVPEIKTKVGTMKGLVDRAITGIRQIAGNLRPPALDMGIGAAIEWLVAEFRQHHSSDISLEIDGLEPELWGDSAMALYRIVQESLNNIAKYAHADRVSVRLVRVGDYLELTVRDNGVGFDPVQQQARRSYGILGMRERALSLGAELRVESQPGQGTQVYAAFPLPAGDALTP